MDEAKKGTDDREKIEDAAAAIHAILAEKGLTIQQACSALTDARSNLYNKTKVTY
jgi:hypothetical protein